MATIEERINTIIYEVLHERIDYNDITPDKIIVNDLLADSMDIMEIILALMEEFKIKIDVKDTMSIKSIGDLHEYIKQSIALKEKA